MQQPEIRLLSAGEAPGVFLELAQLHAEEISGGFLTSLGTPLLANLYRAIGRSPDAFIITANLDGRVVGFLCGSTDTRRVYRRVLMRSWPRLLPALLPRLFSLRTVKRVWETLRYPSRLPVPDLPAAEILNFCVTRRRHRAGIGRLIFAAMEDEFLRRGVRDIRIVTGENQESAIRFYEKLGAQVAAKIEVHTAVPSRMYRYTIQNRGTRP